MGFRYELVSLGLGSGDFPGHMDRAGVDGRGRRRRRRRRQEALQGQHGRGTATIARKGSGDEKTATAAAAAAAPASRCGSTIKGLLLFILCLLIPVGFEKPTTSIPIFFLSCESKGPLSTIIGVAYLSVVDLAAIKPSRSRQRSSLPPRIRARRDQRQRYVSPDSIRRQHRGLAMLISEVDIRRLVLAYIGFCCTQQHVRTVSLDV
uniref:Uncharacterized protein n=1 Tax=Oryza sativa subsp. japonica TaxID=39947 RepID=Q60E64_ORYSJ|nr:hypothetical protein [Oryza sativa Japonica Group]